MRFILFVFLFASLFSAPAARAEALKIPAYSFDPAKLRAAEDDFHFLRSFVDFFYLMVKENEARLPVISRLSATKGWCVGDAHPENFGALLLADGSSRFTVNDIDDAGPCPVVLDIVRLALSARLADKDFKVKPILEAYLAGQEEGRCDVSPEASALLAKSQQRGVAPAKDKVAGDRLRRDGNFEEVSAEDRARILAALEVAKLPIPKRAKLVDIASTAKVGGGSGGLKRYELLFQTDDGQLHLELKQEARPSTYPVSGGDIPAFPARLAKTLLMEQGEAFHPLQAAVKIGAMNFFARPRFAGNVGVKLNKDSFSLNRGLILHEACLLGVFHGQASGPRGWLRALDLSKLDGLEDEIKELAKAFRAAYESTL